MLVTTVPASLSSSRVNPMTIAEVSAPTRIDDLLRPRRGADQEARLEVLRGRAAVRGGDADDPGDRERRQAVLGADPAEERRRSGRSSSSVATVIPEIGFDDEPISPVSRDETVTNRKPKSDDHHRADDPAGDVGRASGASRRSRRPAPIVPSADEPERQVALGPAGACRPLACPSAARSRRPDRSELDDQRQRLEQADDPARGDRPRADVEDVRVADLLGIHLRDQLGAGEDRRWSRPRRRRRWPGSAPGTPGRPRRPSRRTIRKPMM